jgi:hypothetical protein
MDELPNRIETCELKLKYVLKLMCKKKGPESPGALFESIFG